MVSSEIKANQKTLVMISELLFYSQDYIRHIKGPQSVSLRDVKRAIKLINWFQQSIGDRKNLKEPKRKTPTRYKYSPGRRAPELPYVLSLGLCYQARLYQQNERLEYRRRMTKIFRKHNAYLTDEQFKDMLYDEQKDWIDRMTCPPATAQNEALLENVLIMIVCIMTRIPVFIIGAPGR